MLRRIFTLLSVLPLVLASPVWAAPNYHLVGWTNVIVPGGGKLLQEQYLTAAAQAVLEIGAFGGGYHLSAREPMTLDGVPEDLPTRGAPIFKKAQTVKTCVKHAANGHCTKYASKTLAASTISQNGPRDISRSIYADWLQELGIKAHMVNIYDSYREVAREQGVNFRQAEIDSTSTRNLFLAPFRPKNFLSAKVWIPMILTAGALIYSYSTFNAADYPALSPFTSTSRALYTGTYTGVYPVGSGAPEEMFYRGFIQSEMLALTRTHWVSVPVSTALYALSHSPADQLGAAVSGLYLGLLTAHEQGRLSLGITYHFWSDVLTGIYSIALIRLQQNNSSAPPATMNLNFTF